MGALLEQYFQTVVVDKVEKAVKGVKNNLEAECNEIKGKLNRMSAEIENLKKQVSAPGKAGTTPKPAPAKKAPAKKPVAKKAPARKPAKKATK